MVFRHIKLLILTLMLVLGLAMLGGCIDMDDIAVDLGFENEIDNMNRKFNVVFRNVPGISITSSSNSDDENLYTVDRGGFLTLKFVVNEGYEYIPELNKYEAEYDSAKGEYVIELRNISAPMTVDIVVGKTEDKYKVEFLSNLDGVKLPKNIEMWDWQLEKHTGLKAVWDDSIYQFVAWSQGAPIGDGGDVVSTDAEFMYDPEIYEGKKLVFYANFTSNIHVPVAYKADCGTIELPMLKQHTDYVRLGQESIFSMYQVMNSVSLDKYFKREGYVAIGYSTVQIDDFASFSCTTITDKDSCDLCPCIEHIPGFVNLGGVTELIEETQAGMDLNVVWVKETSPLDFKYSLVTLPTNDTEDGSVETVKEEFKITAYSGQGSIVVIPEYIDGVPVVSIESGAFNSSEIKTLVLSKNIKTVKANAFTNSHNISEVVFFDTLQDISNDSFYKASKDTNHIKTIVINSAMLPAYSGTPEGSYAVKYERLRTLNKANEKKLIVLSGSSSLNGLNSKYLEKLIGDGYNVINYGVDNDDSAAFYLDVISNYLQNGDIVVHAPEISSSTSLGLNEIRWTLFRGNNQCYDIFREVDMRMYTNFWNAWADFKENSSYKTGQEYQKDTELNKYGDLTTVRSYKKYTLDNSNSIALLDSVSVWNSVKMGAENLNRIFDEKIATKGAMLLESFAPVDDAFITDEADKYDQITQKYADQLYYPVISNIGTFLMDEKDMADTWWNCTNQGAVKRTNELAKDIKEYLKLSGSAAHTYKPYAQRSAMNTPDSEYPKWNDKNMQ